MHRFEQRYAALIGDRVLAPLRAILEDRLPRVLPSVVAQAERLRLDAPFDDVVAALDEVRLTYLRTVPDRTVEDSALLAASMMNTTNRDTFRRQMRTVLGVEPISMEPWLRDEVLAFTRENASLIKSLPTETLTDIEQRVFRAVRAGETSATIMAFIRDELGRSRARAELIARDQIGKFNGRLTQLRQMEVGVTRYRWRTSDDERVRPDHVRLSDQRFEWAQAPVTVTKGSRAGERNHPGLDIQCRCWAEPILDDLL